MTREIALTQGKSAMVDDSDFDRISKFKWFAAKRGKTFYAARNRKVLILGWRPIEMHREILITSKDKKIDHINGNGLDNRRENLRIVSQAENLRNRGKSAANTSGYKGVTRDKSRNKWSASITVNYKVINLGRFDSPIEAARAYDEAAKKYHGGFARLNNA